MDANLKVHSNQSKKDLLDSNEMIELRISLIDPLKKEDKPTTLSRLTSTISTWTSMLSSKSFQK